MNRFAVSLVLLLPLVGDDSVPASAWDHPKSAEMDRYDCGAISLFTLLRLESIAASLQEVEAQLPRPQPQGYSFKQLREAASRLGLNLHAVQLPKDSKSPDQPTLMYFSEPPMGHFTVVRPLGHSGHLVQVLDPFRNPDVCDYSELSSSPHWTGLALVPSRSRPWLRALGGVGLGIGAVGLGGPWVWRLVRRPRSVPASSKVGD